MKNIDNFIKMINSKEAVVGIIGLGYVGLPLAAASVQSGFKVLGFDIDENKIKKLCNGENYIKDVDDRIISEAISEKRLIPTSDFSQLTKADIVIICVPTPLTKKRKPDLSYVDRAVRSVKKFLKRNMLIILESTTYPGTTEELLKDSFKKKGLEEGKDFFLAFSPERIDPSNEKYNLKNTPRIIGGINELSSKLALSFYKNILDSDITIVSNSRTAEMSKILENTYRLVNIALISEFTLACQALNINIWEVIDAAKTKPYGFQAFYPGPGVGGHCIPIDPIYLTWKMKKENLRMPLIDRANKIINKIPKNIVKKIKRILKSIDMKLAGSNILLIGVSYKKDTNDLRESPTLKLIDILRKRKANVDIYDPYVKEFVHNKNKYVSIDISALSDYDMVVICVDHSNIDYKYIYKNANIIFDLKNTVRNVDDVGDVDSVYGI